MQNPGEQGYQFGWFSTGRDQAACDLFEVVMKGIKSGEIAGRIAFVFSNREPGESAESDRFADMVLGYDIPLVRLSHRKFLAGRVGDAGDWRLEYDRAVMERLKGFQPDLCVLAGYMLIVGEEMCRRYGMINLHPAAPGGPAGTWQQVIWQLIESGAGSSGVMMHLVTPELDRGPVATYCTFPIRGGAFDPLWAEISGRPVREVRDKQGENNALFKLIREHGLAREFPLIIATLKAFSHGKIRVVPPWRLTDARGEPVDGYDLTAEVDKALCGNYYPVSEIT
ncbi:MAG: phosphoglycerate transporter [Chloroflexi bacterium]|nr:phosphoglycerate transporter [Chloroflexota bacterium]